MTNTPATFKQTDLERAIRAAKKTGMRVRVTRAGDIIIEEGPEGVEPIREIRL